MGVIDNFNKETTMTKRICEKCQNGEHDNYDDELHLTTIRDPDTGRVVYSGMMCGEHREAFAMDGYDVAARND